MKSSAQALQVSTYDLLSQVAERRLLIRRAEEAEAIVTSPRFRAFNFADTTEKGVSRVLAWLLNVKGDHAQGDLFVKLTLDWFGVSWPSESISRSFSQVEAPIYAATSTKFIDVLLTSGRDHAFAIENKIGAGDQENQIHDYLNFTRTFPHRNLVYLTPDGHLPHNRSAKKKIVETAVNRGELIIKSYQDLLELVSLFVEACRSPKVKHFIEDFASHIGSNILMIQDLADTIDLSETLLAKPQMLSAALEVMEAESLLKTSLMKKFSTEITQVASDRGWVVEGELTGQKAQEYLLVRISKSHKWGFGVVFWGKGGRHMMYGLRVSEEVGKKSRRAKAVVAHLDKVSKGAHYLRWEWCCKPKPHGPFFRHTYDWSGTRDFWISLSDGSLAEECLRFVGEMGPILKKAGLFRTLS